MIRAIEPFEDRDGLISLAVALDDGKIDFLELGEFKEHHPDEKKYIEKLIERSVWTIYPDPRPYIDMEDTNLLVDIERCIREFVYLPREELYNTIACWVIYTMVHDHQLFVHAPRLLIHGLKKVGKSRLLMILALLSYRGYLCSNPTEASLFRIVEKMGSTIFIDEIQRLPKEQKASIEEIMVTGYDRGGTIPRASAESEWPTVYRVYGPMCAAGMNWSPPDEIVQRGVKVEMANRPKEIELKRRQPTPEDTQELRGRLLAFRLKVMSGRISLEDVADSVERSIEGAIDIEGREILLDDRGIDISYSLGIAGALFDDYQDMLVEVARSQAKATEATQNSFQADVFRALMDTLDSSMRDNLLGGRDYDLSKVTTRDITEQLNANLENEGNARDRKVHTRTVTNILTNDFGFDLLRGKGSYKTTIFDPATFEERLARIKESFGYAD